MPRRPMHLRWIYVKDHAPLFAALAALLVVAVFGSVFLVSDPTRGLLLGVFPSLFGLVEVACPRVHYRQLPVAIALEHRVAEIVGVGLEDQKTAVPQPRVQALEVFAEADAVILVVGPVGRE